MLYTLPDLKITIITINMNNKEGLSKTVGSVFNQSYSNIEYIVIDGGSTDGSLEIIKKNYNKFNYCISEPDSGVYNAMNKGIDKATGDYILFLNSGDYLYNDDRIERFIKLKPSEDIIFGSIYRENNGKLKLSRYPEKVEIKMLYNRALAHPATFIKNTLFKKYGKYDEKYSIVSDWAYCLYLYLYTSVVFKKIELAVSVFNNSGISNSKAKKDIHRAERKRVMNSMIPRYLRGIIYIAVKYNLPLRRFIRYALNRI